MNGQFLYSIIFLLFFLFLIILTQVLHTFFKVNSEVSRKFMHVSGGVLSLFFFSFFTSHWWVLLLCTIALLLLTVTFFRDQLSGIHKTDRQSLGSLFFPIPVYICFFAATELNSGVLFYLPILLLTISDAVAEWGGKKWGKYSRSFFNGQKTLMGSLCFAISAFIISCITLIIFQTPVPYSILISISVASIVSVIELISLKGWDNITVPISTLLVLILFEI